MCPGVGNRTSRTQMPGDVPGGGGGGMVTGGIEPRITKRNLNVHFILGNTSHT